jgi:homoaconitase/3-isopropylmalate dehydratase large subunit
MYHATKTKRCINVAGDLQFELHQKTLLFTLYQNFYRRYWLFCGIRGKVFENMSMEGAVCNSIEMGARGGMIAPDQTTLII